MTTLVRARVFHTPRSPSEDDDALEVFEDGALVYDDGGRIVAVGPAPDVSRAHQDHS